MTKPTWRLKLVAEVDPSVASETGVARIEREDFTLPETLGPTLEEGKALMAAIQAEIVRAQVAVMGERFRGCAHCGAKLLSKGYCSTTFHSLFGDVRLRVRRLSVCTCPPGMSKVKSLATLPPIGGTAPELTYFGAKFAALVPFARVADLLSEILSTDSPANTGTVPSCTLHVGSTVAQMIPVGAEALEPDAVTTEVIVGLDGGYVRSRHLRPQRNLEAAAGKVVGTDETQHRFCFPRGGGSAGQFARTLVRAGVRGRAPAKVLSDGDAGLRKLQRQVLPMAPVVLDRVHIAMRFQHAMQTTAGLGTSTAGAHAGTIALRDVAHAKWRVWHGRWQGCLAKLARLSGWAEAKRIHDINGVFALRQNLHDLIAYVETHQSALVNHGARLRHGAPISTAFVESAIAEVIARRMIKKQQTRWNRWTVQPFPDVRVAVPDGTMEVRLRKRFPDLRPANDPIPMAAAA